MIAAEFGGIGASDGLPERRPGHGGERMCRARTPRQWPAPGEGDPPPAIPAGVVAS
jgi:hypothetical protein